MFFQNFWLGILTFHLLKCTGYEKYFVSSYADCRTAVCPRGTTGHAPPHPPGRRLAALGCECQPQTMDEVLYCCTTVRAELYMYNTESTARIDIYMILIR